MFKIKSLIAKIICSTLVGKIIERILKNKIPFMHMKDLVFDCSSDLINPVTKAQIYFGIYESAEYRFCAKYIDQKSIIIELGSSIGLISTVVSRMKNPQQIISIEANPYLIGIIETNFLINKVVNYKIINNGATITNLFNTNLKIKSTNNDRKKSTNMTSILWAKKNS
jgi:hypothetical protein